MSNFEHRYYSSFLIKKHEIKYMKVNIKEIILIVILLQINSRLIHPYIYPDLNKEISTLLIIGIYFLSKYFYKKIYRKADD